jgi:hypothetical protein
MDGWPCQQRMGSRRRVHNCHADCREAGRFRVAEEVGERAAPSHRHKLMFPFHVA